jgi:hypothetical protein
LAYRTCNSLAAGLLLLNGLSCVADGSNLAVSGGAPVMAAVAGRVSDCGRPVEGAQVLLKVQQNSPEQARPVDAQIGPVTTDHDGQYLIEVSPAFAVPGRAEVQLQVNSLEVREASLEFRLGLPPRDTLVLNTDLGVHRGTCR